MTTTAPRKKAATQLLVPPYLKADMQALAVVREQSVAEVSRTALEAYIPIMSRKHETQLRHLDLAFKVMRVEPAEALQAMIDRKIRFSELFDDAGVPLPMFPGGV